MGRDEHFIRRCRCRHERDWLLGVNTNTHKQRVPYTRPTGPPRSASMGQLLSRLKVVIGTLRELDAEYHAFQKRVNLSPGLPVNEPTLPFWTVPPTNLPTRINSALPTHVDVLVIGSGITGVSCVRTLLKKGPPGLRILVLEARDVCSGATGR
jgi:hypothetical protein